MCYNIILMHDVEGQLEHFQFYSTLNITYHHLYIVLGRPYKQTCLLSRILTTDCFSIVEVFTKCLVTDL
jgi:hypothetical protein